MKSVGLLVLTAITFAAYILGTTDQAADLVSREERALEALRHRLAAADRAPGEEAGYTFDWVGGGDFPEMLLARPKTHAVDGIRHFAALPDGTVYEFDTVLIRARHNHPAVEPLLVFLSVPEGKRPRNMTLFGWHRVERPHPYN